MRANPPFITSALAVALILSFAALAFKSFEVTHLRTDLSACRAKTATPHTSVKLEADLRATTQKTEIVKQEAQADVKAAPDPQCQNPEPLLDVWRNNIERLRP